MPRKELSPPDLFRLRCTRKGRPQSRLRAREPRHTLTNQRIDLLQSADMRPSDGRSPPEDDPARYLDQLIDGLHNLFSFAAHVACVQPAVSTGYLRHCNQLVGLGVARWR